MQNDVVYEIERKFLICFPDLDRLQQEATCRRIEIVQTYLTSGEAGLWERVRKSSTQDSVVYTHTAKRRVSDVRREEYEREVTKEEYEALLQRADRARRPLLKTRYVLLRSGQSFEIDVYPFWQDRAILEVELKDENDPIVFPEEVSVLREVTGEAAYSNSALALLSDAQLKK